MSTIAQNTAGLSRLAWTAGIVVGASLPHWTSLPVWMPLLLCACIGWRFATRLLRWPLPERRIMWLVTIVALGAVLVEFRTINGLTPGTALLIVMVSLKFLEAKSQRDHMLLTVIAYFLVFASLLAGGGLIKGLYLLAFVWITTLGLLQVGRQGPLLASRPMAKLAGRLLTHSLPVMIVLFLLFPRLPGPLWGLPGDTSSGASGLAGLMSPGDITDLGLSDEIAFRVEFIGQPPAPSELYWRGPVLEMFDGRTWSQNNNIRGRVDNTLEYLGQTSRYRVMLEPDGRGWAFAIDMPESWESEDRRRSIVMSDDYQLRYAFGVNTGRLTYLVTSHSLYRAAEVLTPNEIAFFTRLPQDFNPRTRELVEQFLADDPDTRTFIERALDVFREEDFFYTLTPPPLGEHTADEFIFETKEGFCEHYASAFAIMLRMAGVPTRVVTGYQGGELNTFGDYYIVRQAEAHAWTEVWMPEDGWVRVDPVSAVAPERISLGSTRATAQNDATLGSRIGRMTWLRQAALAWDAVDTFWSDWVIGYGPALQRTLIESLGLERPDRRDLFLMSVAATALLVAALAFYSNLGSRRGRRRDAAARSFERFERKLRRLSVEPMQAGETPSAYAKRARNLRPADADTIAAITVTYLAARYEPDPAGAALARLVSLVGAFRPSRAPA
jgi:transglutaminase-like putative cysteine protease